MTPDGIIVERSRLLATLTELEGQGAVVVLVAGAGYGKSNLLHQWSRRSPHVVVAAVTEIVNDVDRFGRLLTAAVATVAPVPEAVVQRSLGRGPDWISDIVPALLLVARNHPVALAVDDAHLLDSADALELIDALTYGWPRPSTLILSGRQRPPIPLVRQAIDCPNRTIGEDELDFDIAEIAQLVEGNARRAADVRAMTGGWPAGIRLALLATGWAPDTTADGSSVADYIERHLLGQFSPAELDFLAHVAVLAPATATTLDAVLNRDDTLVVLHELRHRGLPMVSIPDHADAPIAVHSLLADVLAARLRQVDAERESALLDRGIAVAERTGQYQHAFALARRHGDTARLRQMVYRHMGHLVLSGRTALLAAWLGQFPREDLQSEPTLAIPAALTITARHEEAVRTWLAPLSSDTTTTLPDDLSPAIAVKQLLTHFGLEPCNRAELGHGGWKHSLSNQLAWEHYAADELEPARRLLEDLSDDFERKFPFIQATRLARSGLITDALGHHDEARTLVAAAGEHLRDGGFTNTDNTFIVDTATMHMERLAGNLGEAERLATITRSKLAMIGDGAKLERATALLEIAELFVELDRSRAARDLVAEARSITSAWGPLALLERRLDRLDEQLASREGSAGIAATAVETDLLTSAELRVLRFLPSHYTIPRIAKELYVSPNTVKTQCASIYRKLRVASRAAAVQRAGELGLLRSGHEPRPAQQPLADRAPEASRSAGTSTD